ncbi:MAG: Gfo/Idh/MocA family oxidoreductase [Anaerolineales bacterium]|nr:Gfo/Idh/MocA family oxidoreductase [Anaerolineales bacterium]
MKTLRAGIIGCGNITLNAHAPALQRTSGVQVVGVSDPVEPRRARVQELLGLPPETGFADYGDLLAAGVDYVVLTVPQSFRRPIVEECARAGVHVLSEKPVATVPADAEAMITAMRAANLRFGMVHNYVYYPEYVQARALVEAGALGRLRHVLLNFMGMPDHPGAAEYRPAWRHDPLEAGGGVLMDMVHVVYLAEFFFGSPIRFASALVDNVDHPGDQVEDFTLAQYGFDQGYATVQMWWGEGPGGLELSGTDGRLVLTYQNYDTGPFTTLASFTLVNRQGRLDDLPRAKTSGVHNFDQVHADFAAAVREGREPAAPAEAGLRALEGVLAAYTSAAMGRVAPLPLGPDHPVHRLGLAGLKELPVWPESPVRRRGILGLAPDQA